jgi:hypothetical protein
MAMKGVPIFSRPPVENQGQHQRYAGIGPAFRAAARRPSLVNKGIGLLWFHNSAWLDIPCGAMRIKFRLYDEPHGSAKLRAKVTKGQMVIAVTGSLGKYKATVQNEDPHLLRITVRLQTKWKAILDAREPEVIVTGLDHEPLVNGLLFTRQTGPTAAQVFFGYGSSTALYFQNLNALNAYSAATSADLLGSVKVHWPELGLKLPAGRSPLLAKQPVIITDAFIRLGQGSDLSEAAIAAEFFSGLSLVGRSISRPSSQGFDWEAAARRTLRDLSRSPNCLRRLEGATYLNAYLGSVDKPPESMVQAAVLVPLVEYERWLGKKVALLTKLQATLPTFFIKKLGTIARWLPGQTFDKREPSEEEKPERMDSWYLLHTMMNLGRLAALGRDAERGMFLEGLPYLIRVAKHFDYDWPVFYHRRTLAVAKRETEDGKGGEQDAAGLYAHVMMQAWQLTNDPTFLNEAQTSAKKLSGLGFGVLYQTNNTMFSAIALAWLWQATGNGLYKDLSFVCMGSIFSHLWLWEPRREGTPLRTFMGLPPLHDAPYIAAYEEAEVFSASRTYLEILGSEVPPALEEIVVEYGRHLLDRAKYYFPTELPSEFVSKVPKEGRAERSLAIPVEDLYPSSETAGQVGQEVYGAALALVLSTRSYHRWKNVPFTLWCDAPLCDCGFTLPTKVSPGTLTLTLRGTPQCKYIVRLFPHPRARRREFNLRFNDNKRVKKPLVSEGGLFDHQVPGGTKVLISWI